MIAEREGTLAAAHATGTFIVAEVAAGSAGP
jgi:hypothetical protein